VNWARDLGLFADFGAIARFDRPPAIGRGLAFVPALAGLACPHWDRRARGAWLGLGLDHDRADLMQALLEGVALRTAEALGAIAQAVPLADTLTIDGGMSANGHFCRFLADALGRRIIVSAEPELTALGTAALAAAGVGQAVDCTPRGPAIEPDARAPRADWAARFAAARAAVQGYGAAAG
jgi:glycerol kinase